MAPPPPPAVHVPTVYRSKTVGDGSAGAHIDAAGHVGALLAARFGLKPTTCRLFRDLFATAYTSQRLKNYPTEQALAALFGIACRLHGEPWSVKQILAEMGRPRCEPDRIVIRLAYNACGKPPYRRDAEVVVRRCCLDTCSGNPGVAAAALQMYKQACESRIVTRYSRGAAAACVYIAIRLTPGSLPRMDGISQSTEVTKGTVTSWYRKLWCHRHAIVPLRMEGWAATSASVEALAYDAKE